MIEKWVLILAFTSFFNGETRVTVIQGFSSKATCEAAAAKVRDARTSCIEKR